MSYDIDVVNNICPHCDRSSLVADFNHSYNCYEMFREALGGEGINDLHMQSCRDVHERLRKGRDAMLADPDKYRQWNPPNGWGSYETALKLLTELEAVAANFPDARIEVR